MAKNKQAKKPSGIKPKTAGAPPVKKQAKMAHRSKDQ
jgi:hypothetical protein